MTLELKVPDVKKLCDDIREAHEQVKQNFSFSGGNPRFYEWRSRQSTLFGLLKEISLDKYKELEIELFGKERG